jgi:hypothetical protein
MKIVAEECVAATECDASLVATWLEHRNDVGALAPLWERGYVVDTIEVAGMWSTLPSMRRAVIDALGQMPASPSRRCTNRTPISTVRASTSRSRLDRTRT